MTLMWSRRAVGVSSHTQRSCQESKLPAESDFSQNSRLYIVLKLSCDLHGHAMFLLNWLRLIPTHCLFSIGHGLDPRISAFLAVTLLFLSTTGCIYQLHPPTSSPVNAIYYKKPILSYYLLTAGK